MEDTLIEEVRQYINSTRMEKKALATDFFTKSGFIEVELKDTLNTNEELVNSWKKLVGNKEISVIYHVKSEKSLIMPMPDKARINLIIKNVETNEEQNEEYIWDERSPPLSKEELL